MILATLFANSFFEGILCMYLSITNFKNIFIVGTTAYFVNVSLCLKDHRNTLDEIFLTNIFELINWKAKN